MQRSSRSRGASGPHRGGAPQPQDTPRQPFYYGEGAPQGDPFSPLAQRSGPSQPQLIGRGFPPLANAAPRSTSLNTPAPLNRTYTRAASHNIVTHYNNYNSPSPDTPTQSNPYHHHQQHRQPIPFSLPQPPSQMDQLMGMMSTVMETQTQIMSRLTVLENKPQRNRGLAAQRGRGSGQAKGSGKGKGTTSRMPPPDHSDDDDIDPTLRSTTYSADDDDDNGDDDDNDDGDAADARLLDTPTSDLTPDEHTAFQRFTTKIFREVTGLKGHVWPDPFVLRIKPETGQAYPTPLFQYNHEHRRNKVVIHAVTEQVMNDLQPQTRASWPKGLQRPRQSIPTWNYSFAYSLAEKSFGTIQRVWKDDGALLTSGSEIDDGRADDRRNKRRKRKSERLIKVAPQFAIAQKLAPGFVCDTVHEQYLSDELSGPDPASGESKEAWKVRMASAAGFPLDSKSLASKHFLEVIVPDWRDDFYSGFVHEFEEFAEALVTTDPISLKYERVRTGRVFDRLPNTFISQISMWKHPVSCRSMQDVTAVDPLLILSGRFIKSGPGGGRMFGFETPAVLTRAGQSEAWSSDEHTHFVSHPKVIHTSFNSFDTFEKWARSGIPVTCQAMPLQAAPTSV
ncbi:hypothetical protein R3P38DRAFT_3241785 [Favolaschia claudopus]|uniref:Uncharacterized protein n=1 Tax=Favolaschia claudopus TaxID=2862362 RepID=A0AAV9Z623_9AGAR